MTGFRGMDTDAARAHGERLRSASGEVEDLRGLLDVTVHGAQWAGPDADAFRALWSELAAASLASLCEDLLAAGERVLGEADEQDIVSEQDGSEVGPAGGPSTIPDAPVEDSASGYLRDDLPWAPNWWEQPLEHTFSDVARAASDRVGRGLDDGIDRLESGLAHLGVRTDGIAQFQRDADHFGAILQDWATGDRVPTYAELGAAAAVTAGSAGVGVYEASTGEDTVLLDDRPGGHVLGVETDVSTTRSPQDLRDLITDNDALRGRSLESGRIGTQEVRAAGGAEPSYIVQVPPTEGALFTDVPAAYGGQGNSRDWGSNLRLVAGQHPAAMDDVRAALIAADVPAGANVLIVGHSQGGIIANHLAADPSFNSPTGATGTYNVTHTFSVGSPVQTVIPAQASTQSVNVNHEAAVGTGGFSGDLIAAADLAGAQPGGTHLSAPTRHEVTLAPSPGADVDLIAVLESEHNSVGPGHDPTGGYAGSVARATAGDPTLSALEDDLTGTYLGEGTYVSRSEVVNLGRGAA
ncbi:WXG100 family type VII secretion target [Brachybacterium alimentarium]|uniref:WXG100 family type VII secretion target n=1 Tax=Brachybacterium alimentarium TaxID=47845 RepID=UPI003FD31263